MRSNFHSRLGEIVSSIYFLFSGTYQGTNRYIFTPSAYIFLLDTISFLFPATCMVYMDQFLHIKVRLFSPIC